MPSSRSRYRTEGTPDYSHRFHAGNVGDVWKHCVLLDVLRKAGTAGTRIAYVESHAGEGRYSLATTGEWTEGIGRLWNLDVAELRSAAVSDYVASCRMLGAGHDKLTAYPGSPLFASAVLGVDATLTFYESDTRACERLRSALRGDARTRAVCADGLAALPDLVRAAESETTGDAVVVLIDPPYTEKADWVTVPDAMIAAAEASARACLLLWYPVKSLTRPNAMIARLEAAGVHATLLELITTPLTHQRQRLNGSGMIIVRPPAAVVESVAAAAAALGPQCATRIGAWSFRMVAW